jgi:hypothetical protein
LPTRRDGFRHSGLPGKLVAAFAPPSGVALGHRRNHAKGICFTGIFKANGTAQPHCICKGLKHSSPYMRSILSIAFILYFGDSIVFATDQFGEWNLEKTNGNAIALSYRDIRLKDDKVFSAELDFTCDRLPTRERSVQY